MRIEEVYEAKSLPEIYYRETPPTVPDEYMARADGIRGEARKVLLLYLHDDNYEYLWQMKDNIPEKMARKIDIESLTRCTSKLEYAIITDDLLAMKRFKNAPEYLASFALCAEKVREIMVHEPPQMGGMSFVQV